jgi:hypothetical protein
MHFDVNFTLKYFFFVQYLVYDFFLLICHVCRRCFSYLVYCTVCNFLGINNFSFHFILLTVTALMKQLLKGSWPTFHISSVGKWYYKKFYFALYHWGRFSPISLYLLVPYIQLGIDTKIRNVFYINQPWGWGIQNNYIQSYLSLTARAGWV